MLFIIGYMGLFVYIQKGSIISMVDLPTTEIIEPKNSSGLKRVRLPTPAQLIRLDLECKTRTNPPINHCAEMLTRTLRSGAGLFAWSHI
ncbi:hypothetical protein CVO91_11875 [Streptococcus suis]|nr:hypothetical protein CVO91_11875 [Streptococcus suis]